jgi:hypothetical protein
MVFKSDEVVNGGLLIMEDPSRLGLLQSAGQWSCYGLYITCGVVIAWPALACPGAKPDGHMVGMVAARGLLRVDQSGRIHSGTPWIRRTVHPRRACSR